MFFAPPKVKSLSKYSEFGSHMGEKEFVLMVLLAIFVHLMVMWGYSRSPHEHAMIVPVRVLNIKLNAGSAGLEMPKLSDMPGYVPPPAIAPPAPSNPFPSRSIPPAHERSSQAAANKIYNTNKQKTLVSILTQNTEKRQAAASAEKLINGASPSRPRKYVRENEIAGGSKAGGNGTTMMGTAYGNEIAERYEQKISLWMTNHSKYFDLAKQQGLQGKSVVRVRISRDGHILYRAIEVSSGNPLIDQSALATVDDSNPLPPAPSNYPEGKEIEFLIPVTFELDKSK